MAFLGQAGDGSCNLLLAPQLAQEIRNNQEETAIISSSQRFSYRHLRVPQRLTKVQPKKFSLYGTNDPNESSRPKQVMDKLKSVFSLPAAALDPERACKSCTWPSDCSDPAIETKLGHSFLGRSLANARVHGREPVQLDSKAIIISELQRQQEVFIKESLSSTCIKPKRKAKTSDRFKTSEETNKNSSSDGQDLRPRGSDLGSLPLEKAQLSVVWDLSKKKAQFLHDSDLTVANCEEDLRSTNRSDSINDLSFDKEDFEANKDYVVLHGMGKSCRKISRAKKRDRSPGSNHNYQGSLRKYSIIIKTPNEPASDVEIRNSAGNIDSLTDLACSQERGDHDSERSEENYLDID